MKLKLFILPVVFFCGVKQVISQPNYQLTKINDELSEGNTTISKILSDTSLMSFHSLTPFREIIRRNARSEKIQLYTDIEPGTRISINGKVENEAGKPVANKTVYVYQTSSEGWYSDTAAHVAMNEGDRRHARLFGYFKTGQDGTFEFLTVKPKGYPNSSLPAHIHIEISLSDGHAFISELLFDDDPRLVGEIRTRSVNEKFLIAKNSGTITNPVYTYLIQISK